MTIEFADPGFNWAFVWWPVAITVILIVAFIIASRYEWKDDGIVSDILITPIILSVIASILTPCAFGNVDYVNQVREATERAIADAGFSNVEVVEDRFTAATSDGEYFSGALVDLRPDSGYAYRIVELED